MKQMKAYDQYQDSEIEGIGRIPKHWQLKRFGKCFDYEKGKNPSSFLDNYQEGALPYVEMSYLRGNESEIKYVTFEDRLVQVDEGDILLLWDGSKAGEFLLAKKGYLGSTLAKLNIVKTDKNYFLYLAKSVEKQIQDLTNGMGIPHVDYRVLCEIFSTIPPINEQRLIVDFLDEKTKKIDDVVANKKKQVELLEEYEKVVINNAISMGLNEKTKLSDSLHPWIFKRNLNWKEKKPQYITYTKGRIGWQGLTTEEYLDEGDYYLITGTDFGGNEIDWSQCHYVEKLRYDEDKYIQLKEEDVLITKDGSIGKVAQINNLPKPATLNSGIMVTRPLKGDYIQRFFFWVLKSHMFNEFIEFNKTGSTIAHLYQRVFDNFYFPLPSIHEQQQIATYLDEKTSKIRKSIEILEKEVEKLEEYKKIIINEAVTGKIKVF